MWQGQVVREDYQYSVRVCVRFLCFVSRWVGGDMLVF